ncbi:MAG: hypothetical protein HQL70_11565, partial [Magnetococcales bacterium]|nr:hypothetical protein [Magnetococcales bacterium]
MFLNQPWASWMFAEIILVWGLASWFMFRLQYLRPIQDRFNDSIAILKLYPSQQLFADNFSHVDSQLSNNQLLSGEWHAFKKSLVVADGAATVQCSDNPLNFFNFEPLLKDFESRHYKLMPRYLVGTGLLISFTILIVGLFFISKEYAASDSSHSQQVLGSFLGEISFKFFPALVGIFTGMLFNWGQRIQSNQQAQQLDLFRDILNQRIDFTSVDSSNKKTVSTAANSMDKIVEHLDSSMDRLKDKTVHEVLDAVESLSADLRQERKKLPTFNNYSEELDEKFSSIVQDALAPLLDGLRKEIDILAKNQEQTIKESMEEMTTPSTDPGVAKQMLQSVTLEMDQLANRQEQVIKNGIAEITKQLEELLPTGNTLLPNESNATDSSDSLDKILAELKGPAFIEPIIAAIRDEGSQFSKENGELSNKLLTSATTELNKQIEAERKKLQEVSERIDLSAENLKKSADKIAAQSVTVVEETLREESAKLLENSEQALRETLGELTSELRTQFNTSTDELIQASKRLDDSANQFTTRSDELQESSHGSILEAVLAEGTKIRELMQDQPILDKISQALKSQSEQLAHDQSETLQRVLGDIAVKGSDGESSIEPLLAAVKSESERQLERQDKIIKEALAGAVADLNRSLSPDNLMAAIQSETSRLADKQDSISIDLAKLSTSLDQDTILSALQSQTEYFDAKQDAISIDIAKLSKSIEKGSAAVDQKSIIEAMQSQTERLEATQDAISRDLAKLGESLNYDSLFEDIQSQTAMLVETVSDISLEPVLEALKTQSEHLAKSQSKTLQQTLGDISVRGGDGEISIDPIVAAVKAEGARQLEEQDAVIRKALDSAVEELNQSLSPDKLLSEIQSQTDSLRKQQEALSRDIAGLNESITSSRLSENMYTQNAQLMDKVSNISIEPVLKALKIHSKKIADNQSKTLEKALAGLDFTGSDGAADINSILDAVTKEHEQQSEQHDAIIRDALDGAVAGLTQSLAPDNVIAAINAQTATLEKQQAELSRNLLAQTENINKQQEAISREIAGLNNSQRDDGLLEAINAKTESLSQQQEALSRDIAGLNESILSNNISEEMQSQTEQLLKQVSEISIEPILSALQSHSDKLAKTQSSTLQQTLNDIAVKGSNGDVSIEPLLATVKAESERQLEQQESIIRSALDSAVAGLNKSLSPDSIIEAIQSQSENLNRQQTALEELQNKTNNINQQQETLSQEIAELNKSITTSTLSDEIHVNTATLLDKVSNISIEPILEALQAHSEELAKNQSQALQQVLGDIAVRGDNGEITVEPLLAAVKAESERQLEQQEKVIRSALDSTVSGLSQSLDTDSVIAAIQTQTENLNRQQEALSKDLKAQTESINQQQEALSRDIAGLNESLPSSTLSAEIQS